jgi:hypothetical protein
MAHLRVGHRLRGQRQQRGVLTHQRVSGHLVVRGHRPDHQGVAVLTDAAQRIDPVQVDDHVG